MAFVRGKRRPALRGEIDDLREGIAGNKRLAALVTKLKVGSVAAALLEKLKTVDGTGSGLDADTVDGRHADDDTYTPTGYAVTNVDSVTANKAIYSRIGDTVTVSGYVAVDPTAAGGTYTRADLSIPIASNFASTVDLSGVAIAYTGQVFAIQADATNDRATFEQNATVASALPYRYVYQYEVIP